MTWPGRPLTTRSPPCSEKLADYRGASRFTTWAWKFAIFEVSAALRRAAWRGRATTMDDAAWEQLADSVPVEPARRRRGPRVVAALHRSVLSDVVFDPAGGRSWRSSSSRCQWMWSPDRRSTTRGAIYKALHDARRNLRLALAGQGWTVDEAGGPS